MNLRSIRTSSQLGIWVFLLAASILLSQPEGNAEKMLMGPSFEHFMGTDSLGRDLFLRLVLGTKNSMIICLSSMAVGMLISIFMGWFMTSFRFIGSLTVALVGAFQVMPNIIWVLFFSALLKSSSGSSGIFNLILLLALCNWASGAVLVANQIRVTRVQDYVLAAQAIGAKPWQVMIHHIWPNIQRPILTHALFLFSSLIVQESTISFLGMGLSSPNESWGTIMLEGWRSLSVKPHLTLAPTVFILAANWSLLDFLQKTRNFKENFQVLQQH